MKITATLSRYLARNYILNLLYLTLALMAIVFLFDTLELLRRASDNKDVPLTAVLTMSLFKLPEVTQSLFPFAVLFSAMFTFWQLTRRYELIVVRASGFSVWQFLTPVIIVAILFGILQMTVINPVGSVLIRKYESLQHTLLSKQKNEIAIFQEGLWLRQAILIENDPPETAQPNAEPTYTPGYVILHAERVKQPDLRLVNVTVMYFNEDNDFLQRIHAKEVILADDNWQMNDVLVYQSDPIPEKMQNYELPTTLTREDIKESFSTTKTMSFWRLPAHIKTLEETGFDAASLRVHYHNLLSQPLMFAAMVLLAATVSMRPPRSKGAFLLIVIGVFIGFIVFFMSNYLQALGTSRQIPTVLAAWAPAMISFLLGMSVMLNKEDG